MVVDGKTKCKQMFFLHSDENHIESIETIEVEFICFQGFF